MLDTKQSVSKDKLLLKLQTLQKLMPACAESRLTAGHHCMGHNSH
jgi:hypothetical protein